MNQDAKYREVMGIGFFNKIKKSWREASLPPRTGKIFDLKANQGRWGWNVNVMGAGLIGHLPMQNLINAGDEVILPTKSGRMGIFRVSFVKWFSDPRDMFEAGLVITGYQEEQHGN